MESHTIKKTATLLLLKIITLVIIFNVAYLILNVTGNYMETYIKEVGESVLTNIMEYDTVIFSVLTLSEILIIIYISASWTKESYTLKTNLLSYKNGILFKKEEKIMLNNIDKITYEQSTLGKIFNYGTIHIHYGDNQISKITAIPYPDEFINEIEDSRKNEKR